MTLADLLVVQAHDTAISQLEHRRATLPELQALTELDGEKQHLDGARAEVATERAAVAERQERIESEVAAVEERHGSESARLYSGTVTAHKDLLLLQDELESLQQRQRMLEDQVITCMEEAEPLTERLAVFDGQLAGVADRRSQIEAALAEREAEIDDLIRQEQVARDGVVEGIDPDLVQAYEQTRARLGGVGIARLAGKTCEGCHLQLAAVAYDQIRKEASDALVNCPECGRILVRT